jgi:hypothetical protein
MNNKEKNWARRKENLSLLMYYGQLFRKEETLKRQICLKISKEFEFSEKNLQNILKYQTFFLHFFVLTYLFFYNIKRFKSFLSEDLIILRRSIKKCNMPSHYKLSRWGQNEKLECLIRLNFWNRNFKKSSSLCNLRDRLMILI